MGCLIALVENADSNPAREAPSFIIVKPSSRLEAWVLEGSLRQFSSPIILRIKASARRSTWAGSSSAKNSFGLASQEGHQGSAGRGASKITRPRRLAGADFAAIIRAIVPPMECPNTTVGLSLTSSFKSST